MALGIPLLMRSSPKRIRVGQSQQEHQAAGSRLTGTHAYGISITGTMGPTTKATNWLCPAWTYYVPKEQMPPSPTVTVVFQVIREKCFSALWSYSNSTKRFTQQYWTVAKGKTATIEKGQRRQDTRTESTITFPHPLSWPLQHLHADGLTKPQLWGKL